MISEITGFSLMTERETTYQTFHSQDLIRNSPYCLKYNCYDGRSENLVLDHIIIHFLIFSLDSYHMSARYRIDIVRRNSVLVTHGS